MTPSESLLAHSLDAPDERRDFPLGHLDIVTLGGHQVGRFDLRPGWRWSQSVGPITGTDLCQQAHLGYVLSGHLQVRTSNGDEGSAGPGEAFWIAPGHDAWVIGEEPVVLLDVAGVADYAVANNAVADNAVG